MITAKIILGSVAPCGSKLFTYVLTYPRFIHSEVMTHRAMSKNSASSRAIPFDKMVKLIQDSPSVVERWASEQKGMQGGEVLKLSTAQECQRLWELGLWNAIGVATEMNRLGVHKSICNRLLEPFAHMTVIFTGTRKSLGHFFALRANPNAQPEFQVLAYRMLSAYLAYTDIQSLTAGEWHIPFDEVGYGIDKRLKIATGRIARVSYLTHEGSRDPSKDIELHDKLANANPMHASPFEHCAQVIGGQNQIDHWKDKGPVKGNFGYPWIQYRSRMNNETSELNEFDLFEILDNKPDWITL